MALGDLTKQLAEQAIRSATTKPAALPAAENAGATITGQLQAMQKALKEDEELIVRCPCGSESVRVLEIYWPSWQVAVLTGTDTQNNTARVISAAAVLQVVCKVVRATGKPARIRFVTPKND